MDFYPTDLDMNQRWQVNTFLLKEFVNYDLEKLEKSAKRYTKAVKLKREMEIVSHMEVIKMAKIVAMTTTGCAKNADLLQLVNFPIVIIEEAAEVFEAHLITALSKNTQHLILIGDHQQLKPNPAVYELQQHYNLDLSLFERLVKSGFQYSTLST